MTAPEHDTGGTELHEVHCGRPQKCPVVSSSSSSSSSSSFGRGAQGWSSWRRGLPGERPARSGSSSSSSRRRRTRGGRRMGGGAARAVLVVYLCLWQVGSALTCGNDPLRRFRPLSRMLGKDIGTLLGILRTSNQDLFFQIEAEWRMYAECVRQVDTGYFKRSAAGVHMQDQLPGVPLLPVPLPLQEETAFGEMLREGDDKGVVGWRSGVDLAGQRTEKKVEEEEEEREEKEEEEAEAVAREASLSGLLGSGGRHGFAVLVDGDDDDDDEEEEEEERGESDGPEECEESADGFAVFRHRLL